MKITNKKPTVLINMDYVIRDVNRKLFTIYKQEFNQKKEFNYVDLNPHNLEIQMPEIKKYYGTINKFYETHKKEICKYSPPIETDISNTMNNLQKTLNIKLVTNLQENKKHTQYWLKLQKINPIEIIQTNQKQMLGGDYIVDDSISHLLMMNFFSNVTPICYWQKYNRDWPIQTQEINSLKELPELIHKLK